jgi:hypothetical protein
VRRFVAVLGAVAVFAAPRVSAQEPTDAPQPVAAAVLYEVNEALRFAKGRGTVRSRHRDSLSDVARRLADASLLGLDVKPLQASEIFKVGSFIQAEAKSNVDLSVGKGPINGKLKLLTDVDPTRESLDTLVIDSEALIRGELDLTTAMQGFAKMTGRWAALRRLQAGTFQGIFLIPFQVEGDDRYFYLDIAGPMEPCEAPANVVMGEQTVPVCPLESFEFALGIPLTKAVVTFFN